eukprot:TRINITY_DN13579_c0_g1_i1.p1 TRINITY_DN13579_c0_g1~~TRINITY_DN13579_c0_g1_i1.p1  ORF type:complete len:369 (+),score=131.40 TRINITY_DN13579_c0_g1_i1:521-1627(+)
MEHDVPVPEYGRRLLIYTRGLEVIQKEGLFLLEKINLLCEVLWAKLTRWLPRNKSAAPPPPPAPVSASGASPRSRTAKLKRVTLEDVCRRDGLLNVLFKQVKVIEPCFSQVIMCYHRAVDQNALSKQLPPGTAAGGGASSPAPTLKTSEKALQLHFYDRVPFGDLDAVFPFKAVDLRPFDGLQFLIYALVAVVTVALSVNVVNTEEEDSGYQGLILLGIIISGAAKQAYALYVAYVNLRAHYMNEVEAFVRSHTVASGMPVVSQLVEDVKEQEFKEMMLGYFFLWTQFDPAEFVSSAEIDSRAEAFLRAKCGLQRVDFDVDDAMSKLESLGLAERSSSGWYRLRRRPDEWLRELGADGIEDMKLRSGF